jgi:hypothetical protein
MQNRELRIRQATALLMEYLLRTQEPLSETTLVSEDDDKPPSTEGGYLPEAQQVSDSAPSLTDMTKATSS